MLREGAGETVRGPFVIVRQPGFMAERNGDGVPHLMRNDAEARHVTVGTKRARGALRLRGNEDVVEVNGVVRRTVAGVVWQHDAAAGANRRPIARQPRRGEMFADLVEVRA